MGVKGLLPILRSITRPVTLDRYRGLTVAVDAMSWLHKGVYAGDVRSLARHQWEERLGASSSGPDNHENEDRAAVEERARRRIDFDPYVESDRRRAMASNSARSRELARAAAAASSKCVSYAMRNADALRQKYGMEVILVIDGGSLPSKSEIDKGRREDRFNSYRSALAAERRGDSRNARKLFARACSVTHEMRRELVEACRKSGTRFVVAPYEADGQMAQLAHSGMVDLVVTEDSDLLAYGCPRVLFKADIAEGKGEEVQLMRDLASNDDPSFRNWTHDMFVYMCIVNGCDYCEGVPGVGIKTAHKLVRMYRTPNKIFNALRGAGRMPDGFEESFWRAHRTFRHQRVYNQEKECVEPLLPIDETRLSSDENARTVWPHLGPWIEPETAKAVATGILHPAKKVPWDAILALNSRKRPESIICHSEKENGIEPADCRRPDSSEARKDMFKFFPSKKRKPKADTSDTPSSRPPLKEIILNGNNPDDELCSNKPTGFGGAQPIPIHFNEYSSKLVGRTFETLSRRSRGSTDSRDVSRAVQRLRNNARARLVPKQGSKEAGGQEKDSGRHNENDSEQDRHVGKDDEAVPATDREREAQDAINEAENSKRPTTKTIDELPAKTIAPSSSSPSSSSRETKQLKNDGEDSTVDEAHRKGLNLQSISSFGIPAHHSKSPINEKGTEQGSAFNLLQNYNVDIDQKVGNEDGEYNLGYRELESFGANESASIGPSVHELSSHNDTRPCSAPYEQILRPSTRTKRERPSSSPDGAAFTSQRNKTTFTGSTVINSEFQVDSVQNLDRGEFPESSNAADISLELYQDKRISGFHTDLTTTDTSACLGGTGLNAMYENAGLDVDPSLDPKYAANNYDPAGLLDSQQDCSNSNRDYTHSRYEPCDDLPDVKGNYPSFSRSHRNDWDRADIESRSDSNIRSCMGDQGVVSTREYDSGNNHGLPPRDDFDLFATELHEQYAVSQSVCSQLNYMSNTQSVSLCHQLGGDVAHEGTVDDEGQMYGQIDDRDRRPQYEPCKSDRADAHNNGPSCSRSHCDRWERADTISCHDSTIQSCVGDQQVYREYDTGNSHSISLTDEMHVFPPERHEHSASRSVVEKPDLCYHFEGDITHECTDGDQGQINGQGANKNSCDDVSPREVTNFFPSEQREQHTVSHSEAEDRVVYNFLGGEKMHSVWGPSVGEEVTNETFGCPDDNPGRSQTGIL